MRRAYRFAGCSIPRAPPAGEHVSWGSLGRSSVAGGGSLFPPCLPAISPPSPAISNAFALSPAARPRTNALTLDAPPRSGFRASYSVARLLARLSLSLIAARPSLSNRYGVRAPLRSHSPRHAATQRAEWGSMSRKGARVFSARRVGTFKAANDTPTDGVGSPCGGKN